MVLTYIVTLLHNVNHSGERYCWDHFQSSFMNNINTGNQLKSIFLTWSVQHDHGATFYRLSFISVDAQIVVVIVIVVVIIFGADGPEVWSVFVFYFNKSFRIIFSNSFFLHLWKPAKPFFFFFPSMKTGKTFFFQDNFSFSFVFHPWRQAKHFF